MAALSDQGLPPLLDLRAVDVTYLEPVLTAEVAEWRNMLDWDFGPSADLVRRFVHLRGLGGSVLPGRGEAAGYAYHVLDDGKGLIGGLYVRPEYRTIDAENALIRSELEAVWRAPGTRRVEAQLLMLREPLARPVPFARWFTRYPRRFLELDLSGVRNFQPRAIPASISSWSDHRHDAASRLIESSYAGHIDSDINDQYRSALGARRFLSNIVQYPGCGAFFAPGAFVATDAADQLCGLSLTSIVAPGVGHITQLCVGPGQQGTGIGYELLRQSLVALASHGCIKASLTVTNANHSALRLYQDLGFTTRREFAAYLWQMT